MGETSGSDGGYALSSLLICHEPESCLNEELEGGEEEEDDETHPGNQRSMHDPCCVVLGDDEEEYVTELIRREALHVGYDTIETASSCADCTASGSNWLRFDAVHWITNMGARFDFQHQTVYLGISYFDLFLSRRSIDGRKSWAIQLLSVACLSLAAKMEESRGPGLSRFSSEKYIFKAEVIQKMEFLVLTTLDWKIRLITPFAYIHYFVSKLFHSESVPQGLASRVSESLITVSKETSLCNHRPSVISAAAAMAASECKLTKEELAVKLESIRWWMSSENESVYLWYRKMQEMEKRREKTPESVISREIQSVNSMAAVDSGLKRRISFPYSDHVSPAKKVHRSCRGSTLI